MSRPRCGSVHQCASAAAAAARPVAITSSPAETAQWPDVRERNSPEETQLAFSYRSSCPAHRPIPRTSLACQRRTESVPDRQEWDFALLEKEKIVLGKTLGMPEPTCDVPDL